MLDNTQKYKSSIPTCSICKFQYDSYYRIPRVIPKCGHTFCEKCINLSIEAKSNRKVFTCPQCLSQTVIRKSAAQDVPKNIGILDIVKNLKKRQFEESSPLRLKSPPKDSSSKSKVFCSLHPNKQLDLVCQTCNFQKVCSICALISNNHNQHNFVEFIPASKFELNEVNEVFTIIQDTIKMTVLPNAPQNIMKKTQQNLVNQLITSIKSHFKENYYKVIEKKQNELISQVKEIKFEGGISKKIEQITKSYDMLKNQYSEIVRKSQVNKNTSLEIVEDFIQKCKNLHNQVEIFSQYAETKMKGLFKQISTKITQTLYFRLTELPFSLKNLLKQQGDVTSPVKYKSQMRLSQMKKGSLDFPMKQSGRGQKSNSKLQDDLKSLQNHSFDAQKKSFTAGSISTKKSAFMPPKQKANKVEPQLQMSETDIPILKIGSKAQQKKNQILSTKHTSNTQRVNTSSFQNIKQAKKLPQKEKNPQSKTSLNNITKIEHQIPDSSIILPQSQLRLKEVRPSKEIPLNLKAKFSAITKEILRQSESQSLELIGMEINDSLIVYICDYLKSRKLKFSMIKLVKNNLTDEGLSILLGYLASNDTTQVLNLTSNHLTSKCLELFIEVAMKNNFLKTIYLSHNKVTPATVKQRASEFSNLGLEFIL